MVEKAPFYARLIIGLLLFFTAQVHAQIPTAVTEKPVVETPAALAPLPTPAKVDVQPLANDPEIENRLTSIMSATEWFEKPRAEVKEGVVFLYGGTSTQRYKDWAGDLARSTQDVAAVVNRIEIRESSVWDMSPVKAEVWAMWRRFLLAVPYLLLGLLIMSCAVLLARIGTRIGRQIFVSRYETPLLREVLARTLGTAIFIVGLYFVLRIFGLTRLAVTVLGGTGLVGLVLGIAFRDITENFLASIFLSLQNPFRTGDLVQISGETGYVQRLTARTTVLMTLDGNYVQIPNSTVYKSSIVNLMSNPNRRESFMISIGYRESISDAQAIAMRVLSDHPAVLKDPEPWVLVDGLTPEMVNLKIYFWFNGREHSIFKVRSSIIRLVKAAFQEKGIRLPAAPGAAFAIRQLEDAIAAAAAKAMAQGYTELNGVPNNSRERKVISTRAESGLQSEEKELQSQADQARPAEDGQDLLKHADKPESEEEGVAASPLAK